MNNLIIKNPYVPNGGVIDRRGFSTESNFYGSRLSIQWLELKIKKLKQRKHQAVHD